MSEQELIRRYLAPLTGGPNTGAFELTDDVGLLSPFPHTFERIATLDTLVAGVHFFADDAPADIAWKALAVNVSDIVAKGAEPSDYLLSLALPQTADESWLQAFTQGLEEAQAHFRCRLLGGDTVRTPGPLSVSITLLGALPATSLVRRQGAKSGDLVYVNGTIGDAALGLLLRQQDERLTGAGLSEAQQSDLLRAYLRPDPSLLLGQMIRPLASASMDISDGLAGDFAKLCEASFVGGRIEADKVPLSDAAKRALAAVPPLLETVLTGGDDYRILFCLPGGEADAFEQLAQSRGQTVTRIGEIIGSSGVDVIDKNGQPLNLAQGAYDHFA